jgi:hypothetical protein
MRLVGNEHRVVKYHVAAGDDKHLQASYHNGFKGHNYHDNNLFYDYQQK